MRFLVLEKGANGPMDDTLGSSGCARGVQDVHGMVSGKLRKGLRRCLICCFDELGVALRGWNVREVECIVRDYFEDHYVLELFQSLRDFNRLVMHIVDLPVIVRGVVAEEQNRVDLLQPVQDGVGPCVRRHGRPDRTQRRRGHAGHEGLGVVAYESGNAVPFPDAGLPHGIGAQPHMLAQLFPRHTLPGLLGRGNDGEGVFRRRARRVQEVLRKVKPRAGEPGRPREHGALIVDGLRSVSLGLLRIARGGCDDLGEGLGGLHAGEVPHLGPEGIDVVDTPLSQCFIVCEPLAILLLNESLELPGSRGLGSLGPPELLHLVVGRCITPSRIHGDG